MKKYMTLGLLALCVNAGAKKAPDHVTDLLHHKTIDYNISNGSQFILSGLDFKVVGDSIEDKAMNYLQQSSRFINSQLMGEYLHHATSTGKATTTVRFKQSLNGYPVYGSDIAVTINKQGRVVFVSGDLLEITGVVESKSMISDFMANDIARNFLGFSYKAELVKSDQVSFIDNKGLARVAYRYIMNEPGRPGEWEVLIAKDNAEVLVARDMAHYAQVAGTASAFDPDPLSTSGATYGDTGYTDNGDADTPELVAEIYQQAVMLEQTGSSFKLQSPFAEIVDHESPFNGLFEQNNSSFTFTRVEDGFEAANVYYHIDTYMRYLNIDLGVDVMPNNYSGGVQFDPSGLSGSDNSHYSGGSQRLAFGEGGVDDSEDADVIIHELGHGLHDWVTNGSLSQVNGLSEGTGDYFANSYARTRADFQWTPLDDEYYWVFSWDGHNQYWAGRVTNVGGVYPDNLGGGIHAEGQIWSTCLMKIWDQLGPAMTDTIVLEGLRMTGSSTNQEQAAQAVVQATFNLNYMGQLATVESTFESCGYQINSLMVDLIYADGFETSGL